MQLFKDNAVTLSWMTVMTFQKASLLEQGIRLNIFFKINN